MKTNILLISAILACASVSFGKDSDSKGTNSSYDSYEPAVKSVRSQNELSTTLDKDRSQAVGDSTIDEYKYSTIKSNQNRSDIKSDSIRASGETDKSGHKTDQAPTSRE